MRKILLLLIMITAFASLKAQDVIFKMNGDEIEAKVLKVSEHEIEYAKWSNLEGPKYVISLDNVFMVKYANGEKDVFEKSAQEQPSQSAGKKVSGGIAEAAANNADLISSYNNHGASFIVDKTKNKQALYWVGILGVDDSSVMSSSMLEISIVQKESCLLHGTYTNPWPFNGHFYLELHNKSDNIIYVDLGNTFRVDGSGNYKIYYNTAQTTVNHGSGGNVGLNVGAVSNVLGIGGAVGTLANGINVSSGKYNSSSTTYTRQRVIAIPPHGKSVLEQCEWEYLKGAALWKEENNVYKSYCEGFNYDYAKIPVKDGELLHYTFDESPQKYRYTITYSTDETFSSWEALTLNVFVKDLLGGVDVYTFKRPKRLRNDTANVIVVGGSCDVWSN